MAVVRITAGHMKYAVAEKIKKTSPMAYAKRTAGVFDLGV
jgi:hypothetical protein